MAAKKNLKLAEFSVTIERSFSCPECGATEFIVPESADEEYRGKVECECGWSGRFSSLEKNDDESRVSYDCGTYESEDDEEA